MLFNKHYQYGFITTSEECKILVLEPQRLVIVTNIDGVNSLRAQFQSKERLFRTKLKRLKQLDEEALLKQ